MGAKRLKQKNSLSGFFWGGVNYAICSKFFPDFATFEKKEEKSQDDFVYSNPKKKDFTLILEPLELKEEIIPKDRSMLDPTDIKGDINGILLTC